MKLVRACVILVLPMLLSACLLIPGKFESNMDIRKDGTFSFAYKGEVVFQLPDDKLAGLDRDGKPKKWDDKMAVCYSNDSKEIDDYGAINADVSDPEPKVSLPKKLMSWSASPAIFAQNAVEAAGRPAKAAAAKEKADEPAGAAKVGPAGPVDKSIGDAVDRAAEKAKDAAGASDKAAGDAAEKVAKQAKEAAEKAAKKGKETATAADDDATEADEETPVIRKCKKAEIAELKKEWAEKQEKNRQDAKEMSDIFGRLIGFDPTRPDSMQRLATDLQKQAGWRSVVYKGDGIFMVDYFATGRLDHDFIFPLLPEQQIAIPFVTIKRRANGAALVETPGYSLMTNGGLIGGMAAVSKRYTSSDPLEKSPYNPLKNINGKFTLTTDGEILANNTKDGFTKSATGRALSWEFHEAKDPAPKALIGLR